MRGLALLVVVGFSSGVSAGDLVKKEDFMTGYLQRCQQSLPEKGYSAEETDLECRCQIAVVDDEYPRLAFIQSVGLKKQMGAELTIEEEKRFTTDVAEFKGKLAKCKVRK